MEAEDRALEELRLAAAALGDRTRLSVLRLLLARPFRVGELVTALGVPQPLISHHLAVLVASGWARKDGLGKRCAYSLAPSDREPMASLHRLLERVATAPSTQRVRPDQETLTAPEPEPSRLSLRDPIEDYLL